MKYSFHRKNPRSQFSNRGCEREFFNAVFPKGNFNMNEP